MVKDTRKFQRAEPDERREHLVRAAIKCLIAEGHDGLSVRRIATEAGVSVGLVNHHFGTVDTLIAQAYGRLASEIIESLRQQVSACTGSAAQRLDAFLLGSFSPLVLDPDLLSAWVVFWSMIRHSPKMAQAHETGYRTYLALLEELLGALAEDEHFVIGNLRLCAIGLSAILDGLWLEWCLNAESFSPEDGLDICRRWVDGLRRGAFA